MSGQVTLEQVVSLAATLPAASRLKLVAQICEQLLAKPLVESERALVQESADTFWQAPPLSELSRRQGIARQLGTLHVDFPVVTFSCRLQRVRQEDWGIANLSN